MNKEQGKTKRVPTAPIYVSIDQPIQQIIFPISNLETVSCITECENKLSPENYTTHIQPLKGHAWRVCALPGYVADFELQQGVDKKWTDEMVWLPSKMVSSAGRAPITLWCLRSVISVDVPKSSRMIYRLFEIRPFEETQITQSRL